MLIDTHCHINFESYDEDRTEVVQRAADVDVKRIIIPAIDLETGDQILRLVDDYDGIYGAVGVHPNSTVDFSDAALEVIHQQSQHAKIVAIGEIGLDYYWDKSPKEKQAQAFQAQLDLAKELELPVIIHNREASEDVMAILENWVKTLSESLKSRPGVLHSFSAPRSVAERALDAGFYLGFTGPITFKNADDLRHIAARVPLDRLLLETDGPFLTPTPYRGKRNEPAYIPYIAERLAQLKTISVEELAESTTQNAIRLFQLPVS